MGVAQFTMTQRWSITSNITDVSTTGAVDALLGEIGRIDECGSIVAEAYLFDESSETKLLAPNTCDLVSVSLGNHDDIFEWETCDNKTTPVSSSAWAQTELCDIDNGYWHLTGDAIAEATFVLGPFEHWDVYSTGGCDFQGCVGPVGCCGSSYLAMPATAFSSALLEFDSGRSVAVSGLMSAEAYAGLVREVWCGIGVGCNGSPSPAAQVLGASLVTFGVSAINSDNSVEMDYRQGLFVWYDDFTELRLGVFADPAFVPSSDGQGGMVVGVTDHPVNLVIASSDVVELTVWVSSDHVQIPDGEVDRVVGICWNDRIGMLALAGTNLGDGSYSLRGDFDLDGDVDVSDVAAFNAVGCTADVNCDGTVNTVDWLAFLNLWNASDSSADMNMDGVINTADIAVYLNTYNTGC